MPTTSGPSALELEMMKATKLRQAQNERRSDWLGRLLTAGQNLPPSLWNTLTPEAQAWYNDGINAYNIHSKFEEIPDFADIAPPPTVARATMVPRKPEPEPAPEPTPPEPEAVDTVDEDEFEDLTEEEEEADEAGTAAEAAALEAEEGEFEEEGEEGGDEYVEEEEEAPPPKAPPKKAPAKAPPKKAPPKKAPPKPAPKKPPAKEIKTDSVSRPPKPGAPGASTMIKRLLLKDINITNAELMERLDEQGVSVTAITVSTIRSDFRHSLRVMQEAGYCTDIVSRLK